MTVWMIRWQWGLLTPKIHNALFCMKTLHWVIGLLCIGLLWLLTNKLAHGAGAIAQSVATVPRWSVHEIVLTASSAYDRPSEQTGVTAVFSGPGGIKKNVLGFWDGGNTVKIRFTPTTEGRWTYLTQSVDKGLNGQRGGFTCVAPKAGQHGFVRRDAQHPYHFVYDDGTHYFMMGQTYYNLLGSEAGRRGYRTAIDSSRAMGMNKIRMHVNGSLSEITNSGPTVQGIPGEFGVPNLAHFRHVDSVIRYMDEHQMVADLILLPRRELGTAEIELRYLDYVLARYAAFPNVIWCLINEWNYAKRPKAFYTRAGEHMSAHDPWAVENGQPRLLSVHQQTRIDFQFFGENWLSHAIVQLGVRNRQKTSDDEWNAKGRRGFRFGDEWGRASIRYNWGHNIPVVNDEYGYIGEPKDVSEADTVALTRQKHRQILWGILTAGGYGSAGDKTAYSGAGKPYFEGFWHPTPEYGDIRRLVDFFTKTVPAYWTLSPDTLSLKNPRRTYCLSEPGRQYIVYAADGGNVTLTLPAGTYQRIQLDPATGRQQLSQLVVNGQPLTFSVPPGNDIVLLLMRTTKWRPTRLKRSPIGHNVETGRYQISVINSLGFA